MRFAIFLLAYHTVGDFKLTLHNERFPFTMLLNQHDAALKKGENRWDINAFFSIIHSFFVIFRRENNCMRSAIAHPV
jgi:hypothetical protein